MSQFIASVNTALSFSGTSQSVTLPAEILTGDLITITVMHRSALTTPAGWSLGGTSTATTGLAQQTSILYKFSADGTEAGASQSVTQADNARLVLCVQVFRGIASQTPTLLNDVLDETDWPWEANTGALSNPNVIIYGVSNETANTSPATTTWTVSSGLKITSINGSTDARLVSGYGSVDEAGISINVSSDIVSVTATGLVLGFEADAIESFPRVNQLLLNVAITAVPEEAPARVNQLLLNVGIRQRGRRLTITTD